MCRGIKRKTPAEARVLPDVYLVSVILGRLAEFGDNIAPAIVRIVFL
jgi:hypothetical protein